MSKHSNETTAVAYSYIRFSSSDQAKGDSLRRQADQTAAWCQRNGIALDKSTTLHDLGRSAFTGKHRVNPDRHALASFLKLVEQGRVPRGSYLILENLDRLSREHIQPALLLALNLLQAGIRIVQLKPAEMVFDDQSDTMPVMMMMIELSRGHSESRMKSERSLANWSQAKRLAREEKKVLTRRLPGWLQECNGKILPIPKAVAAIKEIFRLAARGYGETRIIRRLEEKGHQPFGRSDKWARSYVFYLLHNRRLLGEYQPRFKATGAKDGEVILNYYPAILSEAEFYAAQREHSGRKSVRRETTPEQLQAIDRLFKEGNSVRQMARQLGLNPQSVYRALIKLDKRQPTSAGRKRVIYLFAGLLHNATGSGNFRFVGWQGHNQMERNLAGIVAGKQRSFPYFILESAILERLTEIDSRDILDGLNGHDDVTKLESEHSAIQGEISSLNADMEANGFSAILGKRARILEERLADVSKQLAQAKQKAKNPLSASWGEAQSLAKMAAKARQEDDADLLLRLRSALGRIIQSIEVLIVSHGYNRLCAVQLWFFGNACRTYLIHHHPRGSNGRARWEGKSTVLSFPVAAGQTWVKSDLRQRDNVPRFENALHHLGVMMPGYGRIPDDIMERWLSDLESFVGKGEWGTKPSSR
jgi:DNA invertase Pin-like site-specific DNA recombinase